MQNIPRWKKSDRGSSHFSPRPGSAPVEESLWRARGRQGGIKTRRRSKRKYDIPVCVNIIRHSYANQGKQHGVNFSNLINLCSVKNLQML